MKLKLSILVAITVLVCSGLWYFQDSLFSNEPPLPAIATDEWETFRNETVGFEIKIPPKWTSEDIHGANGGLTVGAIFKRWEDNCNPDPNTGGCLLEAHFGLGIHPFTSGSFSDWLDKQRERLAKKPDFDPGIELISEDLPYKISDQKAYRLFYGKREHLHDSPVVLDQIVFISDSRIIRFEKYYRRGSLMEKETEAAIRSFRLVPTK